MHAAISGTIDFREPDDAACLERLRRLVGMLPADSAARRSEHRRRAGRRPIWTRSFPANSRQEYDIRDLLPCILDAGPFDEYKAEYRPDAGVRLRPAGRRGRSASWPTSASAASRPTGPLQYGGVIYVDSADKAARFIMDCNQTRVPLLFLQDVNGFMVGRDSEQAGIIRAGAKLVNVIANSVVPKLTVILGGSFGAGNYALCGKAFDPRFIFAWPTARYAVMGGEQAASTLLDITVSALKRGGHEPDADGAGRAAPQGARPATTSRPTSATPPPGCGWMPSSIRRETRDALLLALEVATRHDDGRPFRTGVLQV